MDLLKLRYFYTVAKYEHVTKAAEQLHVVQPAITKSIKILEEDLGYPLFKRIGRNVKLTEYGKHLKMRLEEVFSIIDSIPDELALIKKDNALTVKLNVLAASTAVMDAVVKFKNEYPEVVFNLIQNELKSDCDISVTTENEVDGVVHYKSATIKERIFLAVPKNSQYAKSKSIKLETVCDEKYIYVRFASV